LNQGLELRVGLELRGASRLRVENQRECITCAWDATMANTDEVQVGFDDSDDDNAIQKLEPEDDVTTGQDMNDEDGSDSDEDDDKLQPMRERSRAESGRMGGDEEAEREIEPENEEEQRVDASEPISQRRDLPKPAHRPDALSEEEVNLALQNVSQLFASNESPTAARNSANSHHPMDSITKIRRNRVDSSARPPDFYKPKKGKGSLAMGGVAVGGKKKPIDFDDLRNHGIKCPELRERLQSKAIDYQAVDKVLEEFSKHDKLSVEQFETLAEMVEKAHQLHRENNLLEAEKLYTEVLKSDPLDWDCLCNLAKICFGMGNYVKAKDLFERAIVVRPEREKTMYYLAQVLYNLKEHDQSKLLFEQVVQGYKGEITGESCDQGTYHNSVAMLGLIHQEVMGKLDVAESMYAVVLNEDPSHVLALDHRCALRQLQGRKTEAAREHVQVLELDPTHAKKLCPYLDSLFPQDSECLHPMKPIEERLEQCKEQFAEGAKKRGHFKQALSRLSSFLCH